MQDAPTADLDDLRHRFLAAQIAGDRRAALALVQDGLGAGIDAADLRRGVVQASQRELGRLWHENQLSIAQEHLATAIAQLVLATLYQAADPAPRNGRRVVVACVQGERHELPARLVADALDLGGFDVHFLGADVPTDHLLALLQRDPPDLLALSVTMSFHVEDAKRLLARLRAALPQVPVAVGGHACAWSPTLRAELGVTVVADDADGLLRAARRHLGVEAA